MGYFSIKELGLPENSWAAFETHYPSVSFPPGRMIYLQGSSADRFYYLKAGRVKVFLNSEDGSEKILTVYEAGNVFGEASFFDELPRVSSAITVTCCEIVIIDRLTLEAEMQRNPQILLTITRVLARTVRWTPWPSCGQISASPVICSLCRRTRHTSSTAPKRRSLPLSASAESPPAAC